MFVIRRIKGGKTHYVTKLDPVKGFVLGLTAKPDEAKEFTEGQVEKFADFYAANGTPVSGDFHIVNTAKNRVVQTIEAPEPPVDPIAEQMAANREQFKSALGDGKTDPVVTIPESKGVVVTSKADTKGHPTAKDLAGSAKQ